MIVLWDLAELGKVDAVQIFVVTRSKGFHDYQVTSYDVHKAKGSAL